MATNQEETQAPEGIKSQEMLLNMGPQHPSTHGVLRLLMTLEGETIIDCVPIIGYLHRGIEKILENRTVMAGIRYTDNSDYLSPMLNETAYVGTVEQLMGIEPPLRAQSSKPAPDHQIREDEVVGVRTLLPPHAASRRDAQRDEHHERS